MFSCMTYIGLKVLSTWALWLKYLIHMYLYTYMYIYIHIFIYIHVDRYFDRLAKRELKQSRAALSSCKVQGEPMSSFETGQELAGAW